MRKSKRPRPQILQEATEAVEKLVEEYDEDVLGTIRQLLTERVSKPLGRRVDPLWSVYREMARLIDSGKAASVSEAARILAHRVPGVAEKTVIERLRKNYREYSGDLAAELAAEAAAEEHETKNSLVEQAFAEHVETWDL